MIKIAIASGKGGTGKTFISTNIFNALIKNQIEAVLVDCDAEAPDAAAFFQTKQVNSNVVTQIVPVINTRNCIFCGKCQDYCSYNAIFILPHIKFIQVIEELCHGCGACLVACEYNAITEKQAPKGVVTTFIVNGNRTLIEAKTNAGVMSPVPVIKAAIKAANRNNCIILLDSPPGTSCPFIQTVVSADYVILVTEPTPFGLSDLKQSVATLRRMEKRCGVIVNRSGIGDAAVYDWLRQTNIPLLMEIPFDRGIAQLYSEGRLLDQGKREYENQFINLIRNIEQQIVESK